MSDTIWTDERTQQCIDLKAVGLSASKIAVQMGDDFTRNAVIGKLSRLGIMGKEKLSPEEPRVKYRAPKKAHTNTITLPALIPARPASSFTRGYRPRRDPVVDIPAPTSVHAPLATRTGCAWPINDGNMFLFCNAELDGVSDYCAHHWQRRNTRGNLVDRDFSTAPKTHVRVSS